MNPAGRIVNLLEDLQTQKNAMPGITYQEAFSKYFGKKSTHEIMLRLFWLHKEFEICTDKIPNNDYQSALMEVEKILSASCLRENVLQVEPTTVMAFKGMRDFMFSAENETSPEVLEEITRAIEDLRASITSDEDEPVREALESIAVTIEQSVDASIKYGAQPLKDRAEIAFGKLVLIGSKIKSEDTKAKAGKLVKAFYAMCEKANTVASFIETFTKLLG